MQLHPHVLNIVLLILFQLIISCVPIDPYKNFKDQMQAKVGESIEGALSYSGRARPDLAYTQPLSNGNIEYHYAYENFRGLCRYVFEVDPTTRKIVDWRYDGEDKDKACFINPYP